MAALTEVGPTEEKSEPLCVEFHLHSKHPIKQETDLFLTVNMFPHPVPSALGEITVGVRKARLELTLENAKMPLSLRQLKASLPVSIRKNRDMSTGTTVGSQSTSKIGFESKLSEKGLEFGPSVGNEEENSSEKTDSTSNSFSMRDWQVFAAGLENAPFWQFEDKLGNEVLIGSLDSQCLGKLSILATPCKVTAKFRAMRRDLSLHGGSGIFPTEMNTTHRAMRTLVIWLWLRKRVEPCLSCKNYEVK